MLVTCQQMQEIEQAAFDGGILAADLMEAAGCGIAREIQQLFPEPGTLILYLGSGNNAGDALVAARELQKLGWQLYGRLSTAPELMKALPRRYLDGLPLMQILTEPPRHFQRRPVVALDGLLGIGTQGALRPAMRAMTAELNALRHDQNGFTVAMDLPSGLNADTGEPFADCVVADMTITLGFAKQGLVADQATNYVGRLALVPLPGLSQLEQGQASSLITSALIRPWLPRRDFDFHKGQAGRVGILAGSPGMLGAAEFACRGALRAGAGLVTLIVKADIERVLAVRLPPEVMVKVVHDYREVLSLRFDALAIGPGLGFQHEAEILAVIREAKPPSVIDADAITMVAKDLEVLKVGQHLLTPHPGEMARLIPGIAQLTRAEQAVAAATRFTPHTCLFKGARTCITTAGQETLYNTTGHPGMATGGMGDVLTGVCAALMAQGLPIHQAAAIGAWTCGRAAEISAQKMAQISVLPTEVLAHLGGAFLELQG
jgi:ADP-dependent NAD(P)H-hydrate dehydratase / NAD(P)H-hydrate epimerase